MKAIIVREYGGPEVLQMMEVSPRSPGSHEVLVRVAVIGVNFMDTGTRRNRPSGLHTLPFTPGVEGAGTVIQVGDAVRHVQIGDRVAWYFVWGSYTQQLVAPEDHLVKLPDDIEFETAASVMMQGLTASSLVFDAHPIKAGEFALVHAAAGGVGTLLAQMVRIRGGRVIGVVSRQEKVAVAKDAGASEVIVDREGQFAHEVLRLTDGRGVNVVYDGSGARTLADSLRVVDFHGTLALYGPLFDDPMPPIEPFSLPKSIKLVAPIVMHHVRTRDELARRSQQIFDWIRAGQLKVHIGNRYPLAEAAQAHRDLESRQTVGKLLLVNGR